MPQWLRDHCIERMARPAFRCRFGAIGLHQAWVGEDDAHAIPSREGTRKVARALRRYGVPGWVIERMMRTPPRRMTYLSDAELRQIGAVVMRRP
jgi:hypothetical protein